jgi:hypothetical protein
MLPPSRTRTAVVAVVTLLGSLLLAVAPTGSAEAANDKGLANGSIVFPQKDHPKLKMLWFDQDWKYLGSKAANGGGYSIWLAPGVYHLQFVDQRPSYKVEKYAPTDIKVTVRSNALSTHNVKMSKGGYVTGTVVNGKGKPAKNARVVAANRAEQSFETTANAKGQFAVGGLPLGKYSVFAWDKQKAWAAKSQWAGKVKPGKGKDVKVRLKKPAGSMTVYLFTPDGRMTTKTPVTITSKATGQWWTATASGGTAVFRGLYPGRYKLKFDGAGVWLPATLTVQKASVHGNRMAFGSVRLTKRGGWVTGRIVDGSAPASPLQPPWVNGPGATVALYDTAGSKVATTTTRSDGTFTLAGVLTTQSNLTVAVDPPSQGGGYMNGAARCLFDHASFAGFSVTTGRESAIGDLPVPRTAGQEYQCAS